MHLYRRGRGRGLASATVALVVGLSLPVSAATPSGASFDTMIQSARQRLLEARRDLRKLVSDCNGGEILVRACPGYVPPSQKACAEPIAPCSVVEALRATEAALDALETVSHR